MRPDRAQLQQERRAAKVIALMRQADAYAHSLQRIVDELRSLSGSTAIMSQDSYPLDREFRTFWHLGVKYTLRRRQARDVVRHVHETTTANPNQTFTTGELRIAAGSADPTFSLRKLFDRAFFAAYFDGRGGLWRVRADSKDSNFIPRKSQAHVAQNGAR